MTTREREPMLAHSSKSLKTPLLLYFSTLTWRTQKLMYPANVWRKGEVLAATKEKNLAVAPLPYEFFLPKRGTW